MGTIEETVTATETLTEKVSKAEIDTALPSCFHKKL